MENIYRLKRIANSRILSCFKENYTIVAKVSNFSKAKFHCPSKISIINASNDKSDEIINTLLSLEVFANGSNVANKGYVSVTFRSLCMIYNCELFFRIFEFTCIISIKDIFGNQKIPQSFTSFKDSLDEFHSDPSVILEIDKYISRERLLEEASQLIPQDILTLHIDIIIKGASGPLIIYGLPKNFKEYFEEKEDANELKYYLRLDSFLARCLYQVSDYFKRISDCPLAESRERLMHIPTDECESLLIIGHILLGDRSINFETIDDIFKLYNTADKYDIPIVAYTCLEMLQGCISLSSVEFALNRIDECYHGFDYLKESLKRQLTLMGAETDENTQLVEGLCKKLKAYASSCETENGTNLSDIHFILENTPVFNSIEDAEGADDSEEPVFDFYS